MDEARPRFSQPMRRLWVLLRQIMGSEWLLLVILALLIGITVGYGAIGFRKLIGLIQLGALGFSSERVAGLAAALPGWRIVLATTVGGLAIGLFVEYLMPDKRPEGVADVMEASARGGGRMSLATGFKAALVNAASLGVGASTGREGPVVHLGAAIGSWLAGRLRLSHNLRLALLGCGVAAGIAASFNAPIAGVLFALEVVIGYYALNVFVPIVIAAVAGTVVTRVHLGDFPAFVLPEKVIVSFLEFPAFALLGLLCAGVAILFMWSTMATTDAVAKLPIPRWARPALGGLAVGLLALWLPEILGVGYEATDLALKGAYPLLFLLVLLVAKLVATAVSLGCGFGGGVFSPSLFLGAMAGGVFGALVGALFPDLYSGHGVYALIGMGAVAAVVLGAPISTILIVFEITGDYTVTIGVMVAVVIASVVARETVGRSFFAWQLERRGLDLAGGRERGLLYTIRVRDVMEDRYRVVDPGATLARVRERLLGAPYGKLFVVGDEGRVMGTIMLVDLAEAAFDPSFDPLLRALDVARPNPPLLAAADDLETAIRTMEGAGEQHLAVIDDREACRLIGFVHERDVMLAYNRALLRIRAEERGEA
jgi:CIC family chloride channel protein